MSPLKSFLLRLMPRSFTVALSGLRFVLSGEVLRWQRRVADQERHKRMLANRLLAEYGQVSARPPGQTGLSQYEVSVYSQNGEDGILLHLFSLLGCHDYRFVEFGVGDGSQCNTANLSLNFGWSGLLLEGDAALAGRAQAFYAEQGDGRVTVRQQWVTPGNINEVIAAQGFQGELDLLSIDIDGQDYWVWRALEAIRPRVVVIEYNASLGDEQALTVPCAEGQDRFRLDPGGWYHGASLAALAKLGREKGYVLAGCESAGVNAFFVRQDVAAGRLSPMSVAEAYFPHAHRTRLMSPAAQWQRLQHLPFQEV